MADADDNRQKLFFLTEPHTFRGGEKIELRALTTDGIYRTEDLLLLKQKPQPKQPAYTITQLAAKPELDGHAKAVITWITNWPAACTVESDAGNLTEDEAFNNHRVVLANLQPRRTYRYRISGKSRDGRIDCNRMADFRTDPRPP